MPGWSSLLRLLVLEHLHVDALREDLYLEWLGILSHLWLIGHATSIEISCVDVSMSAQWWRLDDQLVFVALLLHVLRLGGWIGSHDLGQQLSLVVFGSSFHTLNTIAKRELWRALFLWSCLLGLQVGQVDRRQ